MNDLATLNAKGMTFTIEGKEWRLAPLTLDDHGELQAWLDTQVRDPFAIVEEQIESGRFSTEIHKFMVRTALELSMRPRILIGSAEATDLLNSLEGVKVQFYLMLRKCDATLTRKQADLLFAKFETVLQDQAKAKVREAAEVLGTVDPDPKATATGG